MKKVLVIAPYAYLPSVSGGQKSIALFLRHLGDRTRLTVISVAENDFTLVKNYQTIPLLKRSFARYYDTGLTRKITAIVKEQGFDTLIWEHPYFAWLAFRIRKKTGVRTIIHTHNIEYQRFQSTGRWWWPVLKWYERRALRKADGVFFVTPEDKQFAITQWKIPASRCFDLPFGIDIKTCPENRPEFRREIGRLHGMEPAERILLFTGLLSYKPNLEALRIILDKINPLLLGMGIAYKIIICGKGLPDEMNDLKSYAEQQVIYAGFVEDIEAYYQGADIFLNPVLSGGGVKTKMVEAIAFGARVISTKSGAIGVDPSVCGDKLTILDDGDWPGFAEAITKTNTGQGPTPPAFYQRYNWELNLDRIVAVAI